MCRSRAVTFGVDSRTFPAFVSEPCEPGIYGFLCSYLYATPECPHKNVFNGEQQFPDWFHASSSINAAVGQSGCFDMQTHDEYKACREVIQALLSDEKALDRQTINRIKNRVCAKYGLSKIPSNVDILQCTMPEERETLIPVLQKRPVRTLSGVAVIAAMTKPYPCPHGRCAYCPGGPELGVPQSYTGHEPATMRGLQNDFDPYRQVQSRISQLRQIGHPVQKVELIVMGGDWCSKTPEYRDWFVKGCLDAMNETSSESLEAAQKRNETAQIRNIGTTFETRPDRIDSDSIDQMLRMGATRVELGVQTLSDEILLLVERGHDVAATVKATKLLRDSGLKVAYHIMPGLPSATPESDLETFRRLFSDSQFRPDMLKIYPTVVIENTKLYEWWRNGAYRPYDREILIDLLARALSEMPDYVRIQRMQRDIPLHQIRAGFDRGNLRELVQQRLDALGLRDPTIRFREVGHYEMRTGRRVDMNAIKLVREDYLASDSTEVFLSVEEPSEGVILAFLRLRIPSAEAYRHEITDRPSAIVRELRVYGQMMQLGRRHPDAYQHLGLGEKLMREAETIGSNDFGARRLVVNSGIGVREYYRNLGFADLGPYLVKELSH